MLRNFLLTTGEEVDGGTLAFQVMNMCRIWRDHSTASTELVAAFIAIKGGRSYEFSADTREILKNKNMFLVFDTFHSEAKKVVRAMLSDILSERSMRLVNPLPANSPFYGEIARLMHYTLNTSGF